ncbi:MAG: glycerol-3-phosphate 1-O-acyltransferase PlsY [Acaryochloridaceae cyanobacterium SU_2_1]|nr:glycerol-3-phosphate 1-O-acyltransferase PlsY [Acaryochloridaceae cyanobacterium SU_2_1]
MVWLLSNALLLIVAYFLGSVPTGYLLGKALKGIDIREHGSGSTGATNVLRVVGKGAGATVLAVDVMKGVGAISLIHGAYLPGGWLLSQTPQDINPSPWLSWMVVLAGLSAILGHSKSLWLNFSGGKSVATGLGVLLMLNWTVGLAALGIFALVLLGSRLISLSSIMAALSLPVLMFAGQQPFAYLLFGLAAAIYGTWRHRSNIERLWAGTEPRLDQFIQEKSLSADRNIVDP